MEVYQGAWCSLLASCRASPSALCPWTPLSSRSCAAVAQTARNATLSASCQCVLRKPVTHNYTSHQVVSQPHLLLVTLLMCNAAAAEALPLFLDRLFNPISAVLISVTVVLLFGEIIPQALCQRHGLAIGAGAAPFVRLLMLLCYPVAKPIAWVLDRLLGHQTALFRRAQLKALVEVHDKKQHLGGDLSLDEVRVITGALDATAKTARQVMTPLDKAFMLPADALLTEDVFSTICRRGHSRIPIHRPGCKEEVLGVLLAKDLLMIDKTSNTPVSSCKIRTLPVLPDSLPLYDLLRLFETGRSHMAVLVQRLGGGGAYLSSSDESEEEGSFSETRVRDDVPSFIQELLENEPKKALVLGYNCVAVGIVTIEDVIEELLQQEIVDEHDTYIDNLATKRVNAALIMRNLPKRLRKLAVTQLPRIGPVRGIDYTLGTHPHLREWHVGRSLKHTGSMQEGTNGEDLGGGVEEEHPPMDMGAVDGAVDELLAPLMGRMESDTRRWHN